MNERIRDLAVEAGWDGFWALDERNEKFAELIVTQVIDKIESVGFKSSNDIPFEITDLFVRQIKQHFGVEE